jgi:hypothetical protein
VLGLRPSTVLTNEQGAVYDFQQDGTQVTPVDASGCSFLNQGTVNVLSEGGAGGVVNLSVSLFTNADTGIVDVENGVLNFACNGSNTGNFDVDTGATLNFASGTFTLFSRSDPTFTDPAGLVRVAGGTLVIAGAVSTETSFGVASGVLEIGATGSLTVGGNYSQTGGILESDVADSSTYGRIAVSGQATLGGVLRLDFLGSPQQGDYQVLSYGSLSGAFGGFDSTPGLGGTGMHLVLSADQTTLSVVPD